jgi:hypothetical protein
MDTILRREVCEALTRFDKRYPGTCRSREYRDLVMLFKVILAMYDDCLTPKIECEVSKEAISAILKSDPAVS